VASSAEPRARLVLGAVTIALLVSGCVSTQQKAAWLHIQDERIIATQSPTVVRAPGHAVRLLGVTVLPGRGGLTVAVEVKNPGSRPLGDIPISLVVRLGRRHRTVYLNSAAGLDYFAAHLVSIPARATETWVTTVPGRLAAGRILAVAGDELDPALAPDGSLPKLRVRLLGTVRAGAVRVAVSNPTAVPQPDLQLYAVAFAGTRIAAAGTATLDSLPGGTSATATVPLLGDARGARVEVEALPTLF